MLKYAKGPVSFLYRDVKSKTTGKISRKKVKQLLWGDWVRVTGDGDTPTWAKVRFGKYNYLMKTEDLQDQRVLEIIFLDVGQGDGCILTEPGSHADPRILVIDAGVGTNMARFLNWRFQDFPETGAIHGAIITHPDQDHYRGFQPVFEDDRFSVAHVWHNGIIERTGGDRLGPAADGYLTDIRVSDAETVALMSDPAKRGRMTFPKLLNTAITSPNIGPIQALSTAHGTQEGGQSYVPGFAPADPGPLTLEILGPVCEPDGAGKARLRQFGPSDGPHRFNEGITKNGHSVILMAEFNGFRVLMGGDLNHSAETFLTLHYGGAAVPPPLVPKDDPRLAWRNDPGVISNAADRLEADLMKTCHHGSADVTEAFLRATHPAAFVISSGDNESHVHPRPDLLGLLGKHGKGPRPILMSTELLRSTREAGTPGLAEKLTKVGDKIEAEIAKGDAGDADKIKDWKEDQAALRKQIRYRNVGVYGAVNLRTDGENAVIAFRKEAGAATSRWFYYELRRAPGSDHFLPVLEGD